MEQLPHPGPGPVERKWWNQLHFKVFRTWPQSVVRERLRLSDVWMRERRREFNEQFYGSH